MTARSLRRSVSQSCGSRTARAAAATSGSVRRSHAQRVAVNDATGTTPDALGPGLGAQLVAQRGRVGRRARVVPEHGRAQRPAVGAGDHEPVLLAGDRDGADLAGAARLGERRPQRLPPDLGVGLARAAACR